MLKSDLKLLREELKAERRVKADLLAALVDLLRFVDEFLPPDVVEDPDDVEGRARFMGAGRAAIAKAERDENEVES